MSFYTLPVSISTTTISKTILPFYNPTNQSQPLTLHINSIYLITPPYSTSSKKPWMIMVRELKPGETHLYHPLSAKQLNNSNNLVPPHFNLNEFRASKKLLVQGYRLENSKGVLKVLICSSSSSSSSSTSSSPLEIMVLYSNGHLGKLTVTIKETSLQEFKLDLFGIKYLDDITKHKDMFIAVDRKGVLYKLDIEAMDVERRLVSTPPFSSKPEYSFRRKRLVVDEDDSSGELHLVARKRTNIDVVFMVYKFNETLKQWDVVQHLGCNRLLFVGVDHCFFGKTEDFPGCMGNCIVFGANCFPNYFKVNVTDERLFDNTQNYDTQVGVYEMGMGHKAHNFDLLSSAYPDFFKMIWPSPTWIFRIGKHIGNEEAVLIVSSIKLIYPPKPSCGVPWIVSSVEIRGETRLFDPFTSDALPNIPEPVFLHQFTLHYLAEHYHIASVNDKSFPKSLFHRDKVLVCGLSGDQSLPLMVEDCYLLFLSNAGQLSGSNPAVYGVVQTDRFNISYGFVDKFDDITLFKGIVYAVDRLGKLYKMSPDSFGELEIVIDKPILKSHCPINMWRKRLVGSPWDEELYMIMRRDMNDILDLYKLYDHNKKLWIKVHAFVDDQVLVLCRVYGFFVPATEFLNCPPLQNCILFKDAFTLRLNAGKRPTKRLKGGNEIQVFWLEEDKQNFKPISSYPGFPGFSFFSPPKWFMESYCESECEEDGLMEVIKTSSVFTKKEVCNANSKPVLLPPYSGCGSCSSTVKFEGVNITSELMSILQNISEKHGSLIGENTVRSSDMRACALESAAKLVMTLHNTAGKSLSDSQTSEIRFILDDLKRAGLNLGWLDQVVEKVMKLQESKPIIESILALDKEIAEVEEEKRKFLAYSASKMQNLEEEKAVLSAKISFPIEPLGLEDYLLANGNGLMINE